MRMNMNWVNNFSLKNIVIIILLIIAASLLMREYIFWSYSKKFEQIMSEFYDEFNQDQPRIHNKIVRSENDSNKWRPIKNSQTYVPAGTSVKGIIMIGADSSLSMLAQMNPEPVTIRLTSEGALPNDHHSYLKGCYVIAAAYGDVASKRIKIRTERISCVAPYGEIIDLAVAGSVADPDGKNGVRGNLREGGTQIHSTIPLSAGTEVEVVFQKGFYLEAGHQYPFKDEDFG